MGKKPHVGNTPDLRRQGLGWVALVAIGTGACAGRAGGSPGALSDGGAAGAAGTLEGDAGGEESDAGRAARGRVRIAIDGEPGSLNPDLDPDVWAFRIAWDAIYEPLIRPRSDGSGFDPVLADRFTVEDEGRAILFHLRPGTTFQDGHAVSVTDVAFTFDRLRSSKTRAPRVQQSLADLDRVELAGPQSVRFVPRKPSAYLLSAIAEIGILPESEFGHGDLNYQPANRHPVGSGPFELASWERGRRLVLARNPRYWGEPPAAEALELDVEGDSVTALGRARRGELDLLAHVPAAYVPEQLDSPSLRARFEVVRRAGSRFSLVLWNVARPPLDDVAVRRAVALAIDRSRLLEDARHGVGRPLLAPPLPVATTPSRSDPAQAQLVLDGAGLAKGPGGVRQRAGRPVRLSLLLPSGSQEAMAAAKAVGDALGRLGLPADLVACDMATLMARLRKGAFDGALLEFAPREPDDLGALFHSRGAQNFGGFSSRDVDVLLDVLKRPPEAEGGLSGEARADFEARLAAALAHEAPALFLYAPDDVSLYAKRLRPAPLVGDFFLLRDVGPR